MGNGDPIYSRDKMLTAIYEEERITKQQLSDIIGQGKTSVDNNINKLKKLGLLTKEGSKKLGGGSFINFLTLMMNKVKIGIKVGDKVGNKNKLKFYFLTILFSKMIYKTAF